MITIKQCFIIILTGNEKDSREAKKKVRKVLYSSGENKRGEFEDIVKEIENASTTYQNINEDWRKQNFVGAITTIYYLHDKEIERDFLFPWLLMLLDSDDGIIRYSAVKMISTELGPLTTHLRCPEYGQTQEKIEIYNEILEFLFANLYFLARNFWDPKYKKYKYVDKLPSCKLKSVEMLLTQMRDNCGDEYMEKLERKLGIY